MNSVGPSTAIKAIPTRYAGCHFRSRLEARWAVFFDALGVAWEYEPETFQLQHVGPYTPDFRLGVSVERSRSLGFDGGESPSLWPVYVEVKPSTDEAMRCHAKLAMSVEYQGPCAGGLIALGPVPDWRNGTPLHPILRWHKGTLLDYGKFSTHGFDVDGFGDAGHSCGDELPSTFDLTAYAYGHPTGRGVAGAYDAARNERFGLFPSKAPTGPTEGRAALGARAGSPRAQHIEVLWTRRAK